MKSIIDTLLLCLITILLVGVLLRADRAAQPLPVQSSYFTWDDSLVNHKDSSGDTWHTVVRLCTTHFNEPDTSGLAVRVYSPAAVMERLATDGWTFAWTDGKTFLMQRQGRPDQWRYSSFKVAPEKD